MLNLNLQDVLNNNTDCLDSKQTLKNLNQPQVEEEDLEIDIDIPSL